MRALVAQSKAEVVMTLRRGESLLLTLGIPVGLLVFFSLIDLNFTKGDPVDFVAPGVLALAVMSTGMVSLGIATGFERQYGVLKRLGTTPLGRPRLLGAKTASIVLVEVIQVIVLVPIALALGWDPAGNAGAALLAALIGTIVGSIAAITWCSSRVRQGRRQPRPTARTRDSALRGGACLRFPSGGRQTPLTNSADTSTGRIRRPLKSLGKIRFITSRFSRTYDTPEGQRKLSSRT